jgi:mono/diheme cytochrome c family protein
MTVRLASAWLVAFCVAGGSARAQDAGTDDVQQDHRLATLVCSACHVAAPDQPFEPILRPPAPSFESIAQRASITNDSVQTFLTTTHRDIGNPRGMPNPQLLDYQVKQLAAYLLSLRKHS